MSHELYGLVYNRDRAKRFPVAFYSFFSIHLQACKGSPQQMTGMESMAYAFRLWH